MGKQFDTKITWVIKKFPSLQSPEIYSDHFLVGGCKWCLSVYPKGNKVDYLSLRQSWIIAFWMEKTRSISPNHINQNSDKNCQLSESQQWFEDKTSSWGRQSALLLSELHAKDSGFLVNGELKIVAEVAVLEVIGKLDVSNETSTTITQAMDVNGFQLLPLQAKSVSRMFKRHPELASEFRPKNPNLRTAYMSFLLGLIETIRQSPHELSKDDLSDAYTGLGFMTDAGYKLDWLEKKLDELSEKKEKEQASETRLRGMEEELKDLKDKCSNMEALVKKEKGELSAAKASLSFDDVV
ncbi:unnamed protein product [Thlaspi arvense]|uniref:MATH domain-containing protein n=1 Tax=Thlaspi arvense TaxID=13288 RepID=A0AAU9SGX9_THLAR|nr:unnamed protein product [Thlaspi arvense]